MERFTQTHHQSTHILKVPSYITGTLQKPALHSPHDLYTTHTCTCTHRHHTSMYTIHILCTYTCTTIGLQHVVGHTYGVVAQGTTAQLSTHPICLTCVSLRAFLVQMANFKPFALSWTTAPQTSSAHSPSSSPTMSIN